MCPDEISDSFYPKSKDTDTPAKVSIGTEDPYSEGTYIVSITMVHQDVSGTTTDPAL